MFGRELGALLVLGVVSIHAMGPTINYDEKFDQEVQQGIVKDVQMDSRQRLEGLHLVSLVFQEKTTRTPDGKEIKKNQPVSRVERGSRVVYINRLINETGQNKRDIVVKNPMPNGTEYVAGSAICDAGCTISYSSDGGRSFTTQEEAGVHYTDLEFYFKEVPANKELRMGFRAIVK